jgi:hypothetical protein
VADDTDRAPHRARSRLPGDDALHEGHYREILARLGGLEDRVSEIREDSREARDATTRLAAAAEAQDLPTRIAEAFAAVRGEEVRARADLQNTSNKITDEMRRGHDDHEERLKRLETFKDKVQGAGGFLSFIAKNMPWLVAIAMAGLAGLGFKAHNP